MAYAPITNVTMTWLPVLIHDALDDIPWIRNEVFSIAVYSFAEGVVNYRNVRGNVLADAKKLALKLIPEYMDYTDAMTDELEKLLLLFSEEEHTFLNFMRHQNVHGKWSMAKDERRNVVIPKNNRLTLVSVDNDRYQENGRRFVQNDYHKAVSEMRDRFSSRKTLFWWLDAAFRFIQVRDYITDDILRNDTRRFRLAGYKEPHESWLLTLHEFKAKCDANLKPQRPMQS